jgi:hypothetical protein
MTQCENDAKTLFEWTPVGTTIAQLFKESTKKIQLVISYTRGSLLVNNWMSSSCFGVKRLNIIPDPWLSLQTTSPDKMIRFRVCGKENISFED